MCLTVRFHAAATAQSALEAAVRSLPPTALRFSLEVFPGWRWIKPRFVRGTIYGEGACPCSLLAEDADWDAPYWSMRPVVLEPLAQTLEAVSTAAPQGFRFAAVWEGTVHRKEEIVSVAGLLTRVRASRLGTETCYRVHPIGIWMDHLTDPVEF